MDLNVFAVIYKVFYLSLHFVFTIYEYVEALVQFLRKQFLEIGHEFAPVIRSKSVPKFDKIPQHLTVILVSEEPSLKDLANVILWCLLTRINFVSFYDYNGALKKNEEKLHHLVEKKKHPLDHVIWHSGPNSIYKNGFAGQKIHVKVLSGDNAVVDLTKKLSEAKETNFDLNSFKEKVMRLYEFPEPEMGLCCGKTFSLSGYPPWQIRLTEFFTISSHHNISFDSFVDLLYNYNKREQRFGK